MIGPHLPAANLDHDKSRGGLGFEALDRSIGRFDSIDDMRPQSRFAGDRLLDLSSQSLEGDSSGDITVGTSAEPISDGEHESPRLDVVDASRILVRSSTER